MISDSLSISFCQVRPSSVPCCMIPETGHQSSCEGACEASCSDAEEALGRMTISEAPEETTPLLHSTTVEEQAARSKHDLVYERFSTRQKKIIVAMVSFTGFLSCTSSQVFSATFTDSRPPLGILLAHPQSASWTLFIQLISVHWRHLHSVHSADCKGLRDQSFRH